jgi:hypothetical protein
LLYCLALSTDEMATVVKLMFDTPLIDRDNEVPTPFSSDDPPLEVIHYLASDHNVFDDNIFLFDESVGILQTGYPRIQASSQDKEHGVHPCATTCPTALDPTSLPRWALALPRVL